MEFAYNNIYQSNIGMAPYEALYEDDVELLCVGQSEMSIRLLVLI